MPLSFGLVVHSTTLHCIALHCIALHCCVLYHSTLSFPQTIHSTPPLFVLFCHSPSCNSLLRCTFQSPRTTGMESFCNDTNSSGSSGSFSMRSLTSCRSNEVWKSFQTETRKQQQKHQKRVPPSSFHLIGVKQTDEQRRQKNINVTSVFEVDLRK